MGRGPALLPRIHDRPMRELTCIRSKNLSDDRSEESSIIINLVADSGRKGRRAVVPGLSASTVCHIVGNIRSETSQDQGV